MPVQVLTCSIRSFCRFGPRFWRSPRRWIGLIGRMARWQSDSRREQVHAAINVLLRTEDDRAEQIQLLFSRQYKEDWREKFGV